MASYLEIKQVLKEILCIKTDIDENCDIILYSSYNSDECSISNDILKKAFKNIENYKIDKLEILTKNYREVALQLFGPISKNVTDLEPLNDSINGLSYSIGPASLDYCMFLLNHIAESVRINGRKVYIDLLQRRRMIFRHGFNKVDSENSLEVLSEILRATTLKIKSIVPINAKKLRDCASSFEFLFMYKKNIAISEYTDVQDMYAIGNSVLRYTQEEVDSPPQRIYNGEVLDYYTMAMESRDPFTIYISFYHIIEYYFDAVFRKKLTEEIKDRMTRPDFSYKSEEKIYELAQYIKKHMSGDEKSGKGNEFESLKYVLMEYVPIDDLKKRINQIDLKAIDYYQNNFVPFTTSSKTKVFWSDTQGVYTNLATRIYETRNSLVHSKSEQAANQYKPYKNKKELSVEIPLIKAVAEIIIINSSEIL